MKRIWVLCLIISIFAGCGRSNTAMERALVIRRELLEAKKCTFYISITADYTDYYQEFGMKCEIDNAGNIIFCVTKPETISGISGKLSATGGELIFDDTVLLFSMMADGAISPVCAPWLLLNALRSGYIKGAGEQKPGIQIQIDETFEGTPIQINVVTDSENHPVSAEVIWKGNRVLAMVVENFQIM